MVGARSVTLGRLLVTPAAHPLQVPLSKLVMRRYHCRVARALSPRELLLSPCLEVFHVIKLSAQRSV